MTVLPLIVAIILTIFSIREVRAARRSIPSLDDFVRFEKDEDGKTEVSMDERLVAVLDHVSSRFFQSAKMSMFQGLGVNAKLEKGLKGAFAKDIIEQKLPILELVGDFLGYNVKQYIAKNPDALMQLLAMPQVQGIIGGMTGQNNPGGSSGNVPVM